MSVVGLTREPFSKVMTLLLDPALQVLGLHLHSDDVTGMNHAHDDHEEGPPDYLYKLLVLLAGIYGFFLMETIFSLITNGHQHHHEVRNKVSLFIGQYYHTTGVNWFVVGFVFVLKPRCSSVALQTVLKPAEFFSLSWPAGGIGAATLRPRQGFRDVSE